MNFHALSNGSLTFKIGQGEGSILAFDVATMGHGTICLEHTMALYHDRWGVSIVLVGIGTVKATVVEKLLS